MAGKDPSIPDPGAHMSLRRPGYVILVLIVGALGCKPKSAAVPAVSPAPPVTEGTPASEAETKEFAAQVDAAAAAKDLAKLSTLLNLEDLLIRATSDLPIPAGQRASFDQQFRRAAQQNPIAGQVHKELESEGTYKLLRVRTVDGRPRALFRLISSETGTNYHDFLLTRRPDGAVRIEDIYIVGTGEQLSQSMRRLLVPLVAEMNRGLLADLRGADKTFLNNGPKLQSFRTAVRDDRAKEAIAIYQSFPAELREHKVIVLLYMKAAMKAGNDEYLTALETFRRLFPTDPAVDLLSIDYFILKKQYDDALKGVERAYKAVGGDPSLRAIEANILAEAGRFKAARAAAERGIAEEPDLAEIYWSRLSVALKEKNHADTLAWLKKIVEKCRVEIGNLTKADDYAAFVKSPQHAEWLKWYEGREKE
jgi:tetratricopeptide (TPR) repeat protein